MKIQKILFSALILFFLLTAVGCGENSQSVEDYTGIWAQEDISRENGGMALDVSKMKDKLVIKCTQYKPAPYVSIQSFAAKFLEADMEDGFISVEFEGEDYGGYSGTLELQFNHDRVYCEIKDLTYADEGVGATALIYSGTTTLIRMDDAHERMESTEEESFLDLENKNGYEQKDTAQKINTGKSGQEIVDAMKRTEEFTWNWFYDNIYTDKSDTIMADGWTYERVSYPGISSLQDVRDLTRQYYTADVAESVISFKYWIEQNGSLYVSETDGLGGGDPIADRVDMKVKQNSDTYYTLTLHDVYNNDMFPDETYSIHYKYVDGYWVFDTQIYNACDINGNINVI